jgi:hypothetical protein
MNNRGYLQISFGWLFAIVVGIFILFLAIYASTKFIKTEETTLDAKAGKEIGILLNPLETGFGTTAKVTFFTMPVETRIYNKCNDYGDFGKQIIQISQKSFNKWTETNVDVGFENKYIFSKKEIEGKKFYIFSKPFEFPFKVSDLIYIIPSTEKYCFIDPPEEIEDEIESLNQENLLLEKDCTEDNIKICFNSGNCDINVWENAGFIEKEGKKLYFKGDALMYAGIFADSEIYECQLKRLMKRVENLALIYRNKAIFISRIGCNSNLNLLELISSVKSLSSSSNLGSISSLVENIKKENNLARCKLW